jgi:hypothetical protein
VNAILFLDTSWTLFKRKGNQFVTVRRLTPAIQAIRERVEVKYDHFANRALLAGVLMAKKATPVRNDAPTKRCQTTKH